MATYNALYSEEGQMNNELRTRILHDLRRISLAINQLIKDLDEVPQELDES